MYYKKNFKTNLKRHLFTKARLNRSVFTLGSMKSWPLSLRALLRLGGKNDLICIAKTIGSLKKSVNPI